MQACMHASIPYHNVALHYIMTLRYVALHDIHAYIRTLHRYILTCILTYKICIDTLHYTTLHCVAFHDITYTLLCVHLSSSLQVVSNRVGIHQLNSDEFTSCFPRQTNPCFTGRSQTDLRFNGRNRGYGSLPAAPPVINPQPSLLPQDTSSISRGSCYLEIWGSPFYI